MVSVCPGGEGLLTCERISGSFLYWTVSVPRLAMTRESIVANQGPLSTIYLQFNGLHLIVCLMSPVHLEVHHILISQMLVNNVTTEINGSTIYCSEDDNENNAPQIVINVLYKGMITKLTLRGL